MHQTIRIALLSATMILAGASRADSADQEVDTMDTDTAGRFAQLALDCIEREYPNLIHHVLTSDDDVGPPRELTPAFYGCYDWHSAVHGHWLLARLARRHPDRDFGRTAIQALGRSLTHEHLLAEAAYVADPARDGFERPYGLAWLLEGIASGLPADDSRRIPLLEAAERHAEAGLAGVSDAHYEGGHWLASFAVYLETRRGFARTTER